MAESAEIEDYESARAAFRLETPADYNFAFEVIERRARDADKTAFIAVDRGGENVVRHTFSDLDAAANRLANLLLQLGAGKGDFAFVMIPRLPAWYQVMIACMKLGVVSMPGTTMLTPKDIEYRVNKAGARIAIVTADGVAKIEDIRARCPTLEILLVTGGEGDGEGWVGIETACEAASDRLSRGDVAPTRADDPMLVYFTSGTTSMPKMVPRDYAYGLGHTLTGRYWLDLREDDVHWTLADTGWAKAAWGCLFSPWLMGAAMVLYDADPRFDADAHLGLIGKLGVTTFCAPPTVYRVFVQHDLGAYDLSSIRRSLAAGEPLNPEVMRIWKDATGTDIYDGYGQTETVAIVANYAFMPIRPGSMGKPLPGIDIGIVDDDGAIVGDGDVGHIAVRVTDPWPPGLFHGYHQDDEATAKSFRHGWYYTGDTATRDADGYIWFVGRADDIITSASYRISPFEVESALLEHPAVAESAVVAKPDALRGEIVKAYVILAQGFEASDALIQDLQDFVKKHTAPYKYPREIEFLDALPKTISGKIRRVELRQAARQEAAAAG